MKINHLSDFELTEIYVGGSADTPFNFDYYVKGTNTTILTASFDGTTYLNCRRAPDGSLLIAFDNVNKPIGLLYCKREYLLTNADYADGICNLRTDEYTGVELITGKSDGTSHTTIVYPNYQKGDDGADGKSAYQSALDNGFVGTEVEWLASLKQPAIDAANNANTAAFNANVAASNANSAKVSAEVAAANAITAANEADDARIQLTLEVDQAILGLTEIIKSTGTTDVTDYPDVFN